MIEPQNSMMPLPAEPRPTDAAQGDSMAFGEMLAQSLGATPQIDPNLVQQISTDQGRQGEAQEDNQQAAPFEAPVAPGVNQPNRVATGESAPVTPTIGLGDDDRAAPRSAPTFGLVAAAATPRRGSDRPVHTLPTPPTPVATPDQAGPIDTIWKPTLTGTDPTNPAVAEPMPVDVELPVAPGIGGPAIDRAPEQPVVGPETSPTTPTTPAPSAPNPAPVVGTEPGERPSLPDPGPAEPVGSEPPDPLGAGHDPRLVAQPATPRSGAKSTPPVKPGGGHQLPPVPAPTSNPAATASERTIPAPAPDRIVWPDPATQVNLGVESQVPIGFDKQGLFSPASPGIPEAVPVVRTDAPTPIVDPVTPIEVHNVLNSASAETVDTPLATPATNAVAPTPGSALAERVMQAVDLQRTQPPPRSMVVDIPEVEGLRLVVSVRAGGQVSVVPAPGWANADAYAPFADDVARVLAERGFVMTGDGRRQSHNPYATEDPAPPRAARPTFRRPGPTDNDLRI